MSPLQHKTEAAAANIETNDQWLTVELRDGRTLTIPLAWYPRLLHGTAVEQANWQLLGDGYAIEWPDLDEHIGSRDCSQVIEVEKVRPRWRSGGHRGRDTSECDSLETVSRGGIYFQKRNSSMQLTIDIPSNIETALRQWASGDFTQSAKEALAIAWYRDEKLSLGQVAEFLGFSIYQTEEFLKRNGVESQFSMEEFLRDKGTLDKLLKS